MIRFSIHSALQRSVLTFTVLSFLISPLQSQAASSTEQKKVIAELSKQLIGSKVTLRIVPNFCSKVYSTAGETPYFYIHKRSRMFPSESPIDDIVIKHITGGSSSGSSAPARKRGGRSTRSSSSGISGRAHYIRIQFTHEHLRSGKITIYREDRAPIVDKDEVIEVLGLAFIGEGIPKKSLYIGNKQLKTLYYAGCNHLPVPELQVNFETVDDALKQGYRQSALSFSRTPQIPYFELERKLGSQQSATVRRYNPIDIDDAKKQRIVRIGERVLDRWPGTLKGYSYKWHVLDVDGPNAYACSAGNIFVNSGMLDVLETDEELEAIIAHEVAHIEKRHGLRQYRVAQTMAAVGAIITLGVAARSDNIDTSEAAAGLSALIVNVGSEIALHGYSRALEMGADKYAAMYLLHNEMAPELLSLVLRKLQYANDRLGIDSNKASMFSSHPGLTERIFVAENTTVQPFTTPITFDGFTRDGVLVATLQLEAQFMHTQSKGKNTLTVLAELETTTALGNPEKAKSMTLISGKRSLSLDNTDNVPIDPLDKVSLSFQEDSKTITPFGDVDQIKLKLGPVKEWIRRDQAGK